MKDRIYGKIVTLRPATLKDRHSVFEWLAHSDTTPQMLGLPDFPENPRPTLEEFTLDYSDQYFIDSKPELGRCFIIEINGEPTGQVTYNKIWFEDGIVELDIWLAARRHTGKGYGPDALQTVCMFLYEEFGCNKFLIAPSRRNNYAIKAYQKAGFLESDEIPFWFVPDYRDFIVLIKVLPHNWINKY